MGYLEKLKEIKAFVFDVDGVFTDGSIVLMPDGSMCRTMNVLDGYGVVQALKSGYPICIITGGDDPAVRRRFQYLGVKEYFAKVSDKMEVYEDFCQRYQLLPSEILCVGDDLPDREMMQASGLAFCPPNARREIIEISDFVLAHEGGKGAVRDAIERVMKVQNTWDNTAEIASK